MSESFHPSFDTHEPEAATSFLEFLLSHPELENTDPKHTKLYFDLDETMFKRSSFTPDTIAGTWRPDMPQTLAGLRERGFSFGILSSGQDGYIQAVLNIYQKQFSADPGEFFEDSLSTRTFDELGSKQIAYPEVASKAAIEGRQIIFVDDAPPNFNQQVGFSIVTVPRTNQYQDTPDLAYEAVWVQGSF